MTITSFNFFTLVLIGSLFYYLLPKSWQWVELLIISIIFYCIVTTPHTLLWIFISTITAWGATNFLTLSPPNTPENLCKRKLVVIGAILANIGLWFVLKGNELLPPLINNAITWKAALGMSYYTLQAISYIMDIYWDTAKCQRNIIKLFLYFIFFPQLITGPISRYNDLGGVLYQKHVFHYENIAYGTQRMLWGIFKKLVLAEHLSVIINTIWENSNYNHGYYLWIAFLLYPIQLYSDFSGCMDIVIGTAEILGIKLSENFNNPFFARTVVNGR